MSFARFPRHKLTSHKMSKCQAGRKLWFTYVGALIYSFAYKVGSGVLQLCVSYLSSTFRCFVSFFFRLVAGCICFATWPINEHKLAHTADRFASPFIWGTWCRKTHNKRNVNMAEEACLSTTLRMRNGTRASYELPETETVQRQWPPTGPSPLLFTQSSPSHPPHVVPAKT